MGVLKDMIDLYSYSQLIAVTQSQKYNDLPLGYMAQKCIPIQLTDLNI